AELGSARAYLKKRQLLTDRRVGDEIEYVFKHALAQETIYASLLQRTRKELHLAVAGSIETLFADRLADFYGMLSYHFSRAESPEKAEEYLSKRATRRLAPPPRARRCTTSARPRVSTSRSTARGAIPPRRRRSSGTSGRR